MIIITILVLLFANRESMLDKAKISNDEKINHVTSWLFRASFILGLVFLAPDTSFFDKSLLAISFSFLFSSVFKLGLNLRRGKPYDYISNSNMYDRFFIKLFPVKSGLKMYIIEFIITIATMLIFYFND